MRLVVIHVAVYICINITDIKFSYLYQGVVDRWRDEGYNRGNLWDVLKMKV